LIDVANLDQAIAIAARLPSASKGTVEIRPLFELSGLPTTKLRNSDLYVHQFMLLCYDDAEHWRSVGEAAHRAAQAEAAELAQQLDANHQYLSASPLPPIELATSVRIRDNKRLVTDGPFAETCEVLGGFYRIQVHTAEEALAIAAKHPGATVGSVEVRQVHEPSEIVSEDHAGHLPIFRHTHSRTFKLDATQQFFNYPNRNLIMNPSKTQLIAGWILSGLVAFFMAIVSASGKFAEWEGKEEMFAKFGYTSELMMKIGIVEVVISILYLIPRTAFLGAILLTAYLGGATEVHVRVGEPFFMPILIAVVMWVALGLRNPTIFKLAKGETASSSSE